MGLLTDPSAGQGRVTKLLLKYYTKLGILLYVGGVIYFCALAYPPYNLSTYMSENALLPGLVRSEFRDDRSAAMFFEELTLEMERYEDSIPYSWLLAKFKQIGLDTYTHNWTLNYPLGTPKKYSGKNVYAILRAKRAASTEALVLSAPYRPPLSPQPTTAPSIALMLAFAKFAVKQKYWAKDIIFLITEHEQLGMEAWVEAYVSHNVGDPGVLDHGDLKGRAGAIQAAINLELHGMIVGQMDVKIEGLNGQLPNLDLFNLVNRMCSKENIYQTFKGRATKRFNDPVKDWWYSFQTMMLMAATQASGVPNGNHGVFPRLGIQALTMEGYSRETARHSKAGVDSLGRLLEQIFRSLNNLLERFHQSYFFYLLPSNNRFISIGYYMPAIGAIAGALFIRACAIWCSINDTTNDTNKKDKKTDKGEKKSKLDDKMLKERERKIEELKKIQPSYWFGYPRQYWKDWEEIFQQECKNAAPPKSGRIDTFGVFFVYVIIRALGFVLTKFPHTVSKIAAEHYSIQTQVSVFYGFVAISVLYLFVPYLFPIRLSKDSMILLNVFALLELGVLLVSLSMNNISLGMFCATILTPVALGITVSKSKLRRFVGKLFMILVHPLVVLLVIVLIYTFLNFGDENIIPNLKRGIWATQQAIVFSIVDSMIYNNWLYGTVVKLLIPNWMIFWIICCTNPIDVTEEELKEKKTK